MKNFLMIAVMAMASSVLAVESSNTFGILRVDSSAEQTIVSVPWEAAGGGDINVADIVKTANLTNGDELYYYSGSGYIMWRLTNGAWVEAQDEQAQTTGRSIARGGAIILKRTAPIANCFYLYGQYTAAGSSTITAAGSAGKPAYTLLAPPTTEDTDLNSKTWKTPNSNDIIMLSDGTTLNYRNGKWGKLSKTLNPTTGDITETVDQSFATIKAGEGAWYVSQGSAVSVTWIAHPDQQ